MLHAVPELLDALETRLIAGEDPAELLSGIRWSDLVGWPEDAAGAQALKRRITSVNTLLMGLQSPLRAALIGLSGFQGYSREGLAADTSGVAPRLSGKV